ncbi:zinc finger protein 260-like [Chrysoperla carnea]|uniref:zinc finger protein 260-like n=1 Tax=Chrysoperla carnea TaxID=189513 RepID=UPI001D06B247|nr:zinc finger protein 260-like [Chrysoperla carnea]
MYTFHNICRTCSCQGELRSLFVADPLILANMLTEVVDLKVVKGDKFPQNICTFCLEKLKSAYLFKKQCQAIQIKLELYLQSIAETSFNVIYKEEVFNNTQNVAPQSELIELKPQQAYDHNINGTGSIEESNHTVLEPIEHTLKEEENVGNISNTSNQDWDDMDRGSPTPTIEPDIDIFTPPEQQAAKERKKSKRVRNKRDMVRKKVECSECHKKVNDLELHMKKHLNIPFKCEICGAEMLRTNYARHLKAHKNERPFPCTLCTRHFRDKYTLRLHLRTHSGERPYKCTLCERSFKLQFQLKNHLNKHYAGEIKEPVKAEPVPDLDIKCEEEAEFECTDCNEKFTSKRGLSRHKNLAHGSGTKTGLCNLCGKLLASKLSLKQHQQHCQVKKEKDDKSSEDNEPKDFECETCNKKYSTKDALTRHKTLHRKKPHLCTLCGKLLASKLSLKGHQLIHSGGKPYKCNVCNQSFRHKQHLTNHRRIHTGEKPYKCTLCEKAFTEKKSLTVHMRIHTGENPYSCSFCNKGFYDLSNFKRHEAFHKLNEGNPTPRKSHTNNINNFNLQNISFNPPNHPLGFGHL